MLVLLMLSMLSKQGRQQFLKVYVLGADGGEFWAVAKQEERSLMVGSQILILELLGSGSKNEEEGGRGKVEDQDPFLYFFFCLFFLLFPSFPLANFLFLYLMLNVSSSSRVSILIIETTLLIQSNFCNIKPQNIALILLHFVAKSATLFHRFYVRLKNNSSNIQGMRYCASCELLLWYARMTALHHFFTNQHHASVSRNGLHAHGVKRFALNSYYQLKKPI